MYILNVGQLIVLVINLQSSYQISLLFVPMQHNVIFN